MINSILKFTLAVGLLTLLPIESVNAQLQMTKLPKRLEDALIDPNLEAVLQRKMEATVAAAAAPKVAAVPARPASFSARPIYSNEPSRHSATKPGGDASHRELASLQTIQETEMPPPISFRPDDDAFLESDVSETQLQAIRLQPDQPTKVVQNPDSDVNSHLRNPLAPVKGQLEFRIVGVAAMVESESTDMAIEVHNPTSHSIGPVAVNVVVPEELTITHFDHDAWLDAEKRIIVFQLERVNPGTIKKISMKGISHSPGRTNIQVALISGKTMVAERTINAQVFPQQVARQQTFGDTDSSDTIRN